MRYAGLALTLLACATSAQQSSDPPASYSSQPSDVSRQRLPVPLSPSQGKIVVNGHTCVPGDKDQRCAHVCGGAFGPCVRDEKLEKRRLEEFAVARKRLIAKGVPFNPDLLLHWETLPQAHKALESMPAMGEVRRQETIGGVELADTLFVPEDVYIEDLPAVILVNHLVFEGKRPYIRAYPADGQPSPTDGLYMMPGRIVCLGTTLKRALEKAGIPRDRYDDQTKLPPWSVIQTLDLSACERISGDSSGRAAGDQSRSKPLPRLIGPDLSGPPN